MLRRIQIAILGAAILISAFSGGTIAAENAALAAGRKALAGGNFNAAAARFSAALSGGKLSKPEVASALLSRGIAQRKLGNPAYAIADITSALFLKTLSKKDRSLAHYHRGVAHEKTGNDAGALKDLKAALVFDTGNGPAYAARGRLLKKKGRVKQAEADLKRAAGLGSGSALPSAPVASKSTAKTVRKKAKTAAPKAAPQFRTSITPESTTPLPWQEKAQKKKPPAKPARKTKPPAPTAWSTAVKSVPPPPIRRSVVAPPVTRNWNTAVKTAPAPARPAPSMPWQTKTRASSAAGSQNEAVVTAGGRFHLQLASTSDEADANAAWSRLKAKHGGLLANYGPEIDKKDLGALGTRYRIQIGPFADRNATLRLCGRMKARGLDCFMVVR